VRVTLKDFIADGLLIGMGASWLLLFSRIWQYGSYLVWEPDILILSLEMAGFLLIIAFGISRAITHIREMLK